MLSLHHVVAYASKSLTAVEQRYSQTEQEALAVAWGCNHFRLYILCTHFTVLTDQKTPCLHLQQAWIKPTS